MRSGKLIYVGTALFLFAVTAVMMSVSQVLEGSARVILANPVQWLRYADVGVLSESLATATGAMLAILGIAITVVAIIVELAANRYNHRITSLFIREPVNVIVLGFFVITTIVCFWTSTTLLEAPPDSLLPRASFLLTTILVLVSLLIILPYFAYVLSFVSPLNMIQRIQASAENAMSEAAKGVRQVHIERVTEAVDELHDVVRSAMEQSDRSIAMEGIDALAGLIARYQVHRQALPGEWFEISDSVANDPDFVSLEPFALEQIQKDATWFEVKVCRQYLLLMLLSSTHMRDISYLIAINTRRMATDAIAGNRPLLHLCIRCFNSYLRGTINVGDQRTSYYLLNQYRLLAEALSDKTDGPVVEEIARHFQFYGQLAFGMGQPFLLEVACYDMTRLLEKHARSRSPNVDALLELLLGFDREVKRDSEENSLLGVRRAQVQAAAMFLELGEMERARRIADDLAGESPDRLERVRAVLSSEDRAQYWELTDRGINFSYLDPKYRVHLDTLFAWLGHDRVDDDRA